MDYIKSRNVLIKGNVFTGRDQYQNLWRSIINYWVEYFVMKEYNMKYFMFDTNCSAWNIYTEMYIVGVDKNNLNEDLSHISDVIIEVLRGQYPNLRSLRPFEDVRVEHIYEYNYDRIKNEKKELHHSLMQKLYHPSRIQAWIMNGNEIDDYLS